MKSSSDAWPVAIQNEHSSAITAGGEPSRPAVTKPMRQVRPVALVACNTREHRQDIEQAIWAAGLQPDFERGAIQILQRVASSTRGHHTAAARALHLLVLDFSSAAWIYLPLVEVLLHERVPLPIVAVVEEDGGSLERQLRSLGLLAVLRRPLGQPSIRQALKARCGCRSAAALDLAR